MVSWKKAGTIFNYGKRLQGPFTGKGAMLKKLGVTTGQKAENTGLPVRRANGRQHNIVVKGKDLGPTHSILTQILVLTFGSCVILGKVVNVPVPQFGHL